MTYTNFDQFFAEGANKKKEERLAFTRTWLKDNYKITDANPEWLELIADVHDHDEQALHFGQIKIASTFSALTVQLLKVHDVWHIGILKPNSNEANVIHPLRENVGGDNEKNRLMLAQLVKKGTVPKPQEPVYGIQFDPTPVRLPTGDIYSQKDAEPAQGVYEVTTSAPVSDKAKTKSIDVDLSAFL